MTQLFKSGMICLLIVLGSWNVGLTYEITDIAHPGILSGQITFTGKVPAPRTFTVQKNPEVCGEQRSLTKVSVNDGKLQGVVLALEGIQSGKAYDEKHFQANLPGKGEFHYAPGKKLSLDVQTKNCNFGPFTGVVARDEPIRFSNNDPMKHTLHTYVRRGTKATILKTVHNQGIPPAGTIEKTFPHKKLKTTGVVAVTCDRHDFMENWLYVVDNPYFAISDVNGQFSIDGIPPGHFRLIAWHPVLGTQQQEVVIESNGNGHIQIEFIKN